MFSNTYQEYAVTNDVGFNNVNVDTASLSLLHAMYIPSLDPVGPQLTQYHFGYFFRLSPI